MLMTSQREDVDILEHLDLSIVALGHVRCHVGWKVRFQGYPYHRLYYVERGSFSLKYLDRKYRLGPGNFCLIPAYYPFGYSDVEENDHYYLHFNSAFLMDLPGFQSPVIATPEQAAEAYTLFQELCEMPYEGKVNGGKEFHDFYRVQNLPDEPQLPFQVRLNYRIGTLALLAPFLEEFEKQSGEIPKNGNPFSRVLKYIDENIHRDIEVQELYRLVGMRQAEFSAAFRKAFSIPPKQFICTRRLDHAMILLQETDLPVAEIARRIGYRDEYFFYRIFKKYKHISPGAWRQTFQEPASPEETKSPSRPLPWKDKQTVSS